jgi:hypothetical protein
MVALMIALCAVAALSGTRAVVTDDGLAQLEQMREANRLLRFNKPPPAPSLAELKSLDFHFSRVDQRGRLKATPYRRSFPPPPPSECVPALSSPAEKGSRTLTRRTTR